MANPSCRAKNPAECPYHGKGRKGVQVFKSLKDIKNFNDYHDERKIKHDEYVASIPKKVLKTDIELDGDFRVCESKGSYQQGWFWDKNGVPVVFMKVRVSDVKDSEGNIITSGPRLCDIEINPAFKGRNAALAAFRVSKKRFNVDHVWMGDVLSEQGLFMFKKFRGHEMLTGEKIVKLEPYFQEDSLIASSASYTFVKDWDSEKPKYSL